MPDAESPKGSVTYKGVHPNEQAAFARYLEVVADYEAHFGRPVPQPAMVSFQAVTRQMEKALKRGKPISHNHDWWSHLPPGAHA